VNGFRALLTEDDTWMLFHRETLDRLGKALAYKRHPP
jgi:hypothetical protein